MQTDTMLGVLVALAGSALISGIHGDEVFARNENEIAEPFPRSY